MSFLPAAAVGARLRWVDAALGAVGAAVGALVAVREPVSRCWGLWYTCAAPGGMTGFGWSLGSLLSSTCSGGGGSQVSTVLHDS